MLPKIAGLERWLRIPFYPNPLTGSAATLVLGPRQTGKSTLARAQFPDGLHLDLLDSELAGELNARPARFREMVLASQKEVIVVDEVQKAAGILDEVHWLLENGGWKFVLCASSARKLKREAVNLLGGRAATCELFPLTWPEIPDFDLDRYLRHGGLPAYYLRDDPGTMLHAYTKAYLQEEIVAEALAKNAGVFLRFLETVALTHGRILNYSNIARECGVSHHTVRQYFQILKDTLLGFELEAWRESKKRRMVETAKFYLFDIGVANAIPAEAIVPSPGTDAYGRAFEHFILREIQASHAYRQKPLRMSFWRTSSGIEVDFVLGKMRHAIETKAGRDYTAKDLKGLRALREDYPDCEATLVYRGERAARTEDGIAIQPWSLFLERLWAGEV